MISKKIEESDIIHVHSTVDLSLMKIALKKGKPVIFTPHTLHEMYASFKRGIHKHIVKKCNKILALSKKDEEKLILLGIPFNKIEIISLGVDSRKFKPVNKKIEKRLKILFVGRLSQKKGIDLLLNASEQVKDADFLIAGKVDNSQILNEIKKKQENNGNVKFLGSPSDKNLALIYRKADLFVFPSRADSFGMVNLEAMASGLPIIASNVGAVPELIENGKTGFIFEPGNTDQLINCINKFVKKPNLIKNFRKNVIKKFRKDCDYIKVAEKNLKIYEEFI
jgi:glycosyltransferase involved in cell wall biosynthesis